MEYKKMHPDVVAKYRLLSIRPSKHNFAGFGEIDLCALSLKQAEELVEKGFPFLQLRDKPLPIQKQETTKQTVKTELPEKKETEEVNIHHLRTKNKTYVNKLLTLNWPDLEHKDRLVFFNNEKYFMEKKMLYIENAELAKSMRQTHEKLKTMLDEKHTNEERAGLMRVLDGEQKTMMENWKKIDTWVEPEQHKTKEDLTVEEAVKKALEREKLIKAHKIYIYRAEKMLTGMPNETPKQREKLENKKHEIERRRLALREMGVEY